MVAEIMIYYLIGCLWGVFDAWKKKIATIIWIILVVIILVCYFTNTGDWSEPESWWYYLLIMISAAAGVFTGNSIFKLTWGKKNGKKNK